jgi:hypothetical protein
VLFALVPHYVTTDAVLAFDGLLDQPISTIRVILSGRRTPKALAELRPLRSVRLRPGVTRRGPYSTRWRVYG